MINSVDLLIILYLGIYGIIILSGGILISNGEYDCDVEKSTSHSAITSIFLGTMLITLFLCFISLGIFSKTKGIKENIILFNSPLYLSIAIGIITSIISISLGTIILNNLDKNDDEDDEDEKNLKNKKNKENTSCNLIRYGGNLIFWTGIVSITIIVILGLMKLYQTYVKKKKLATNKTGAKPKARAAVPPPAIASAPVPFTFKPNSAKKEIEGFPTSKPGPIKLFGFQI